MTSCEGAVACGLVQVPDGFIVSTKLLKTAYERFQELEAETVVSVDTYNVLVRCLPKLTALEKVAVETRIDKPGLNNDRLLLRQRLSQQW